MTISTRLRDDQPYSRMPVQRRLKVRDRWLADTLQLGLTTDSPSQCASDQRR